MKQCELNDSCYDTAFIVAAKREFMISAMDHLAFQGKNIMLRCCDYEFLSKWIYCHT